MKSICSITHVERTTLYYLYNAWEAAQAEDKYTVLSIASGHVAKVKLSAVKEQIKDMLREHNRNLNPVLHLLETEALSVGLLSSLLCPVIFCCHPE